MVVGSHEPEGMGPVPTAWYFQDLWNHRSNQERSWVKEDFGTLRLSLSTLSYSWRELLISECSWGHNCLVSIWTVGMLIIFSRRTIRAGDYITLGRWRGWNVGRENGPRWAGRVLCASCFLGARPAAHLQSKALQVFKEFSWITSSLKWHLASDSCPWNSLFWFPINLCNEDIETVRPHHRKSGDTLSLSPSSHWLRDIASAVIKNCLAISQVCAYCFLSQPSLAIPNILFGDPVFFIKWQGRKLGL